MKVQIKETIDLKESKLLGWLKLRKIYDVLAIETVGRNNIHYRIISEDAHTPVLYSASYFDIVDNNIPNNWIVQECSGDNIELTPIEWATDSFWVDYFDDDKEAVKAYNEVVKKIRDSN